MCVHLLLDKLHSVEKSLVKILRLKTGEHPLGQLVTVRIGEQPLCRFIAHRSLKVRRVFADQDVYATDALLRPRCSVHCLKNAFFPMLCSCAAMSCGTLGIVSINTSR